MEKRPVVIEGTFEDVVRRFHTEMQKGKKNFSYCGEMPGQDAQNKTLVRVYQRYFLYPNIVATVTVFFEELEEKKTSMEFCWKIKELKDKVLNFQTLYNSNICLKMFLLKSVILYIFPPSFSISSS